MELTYRGLCYDSPLLVKFSKQCLRASIGWLFSIVQAQRRPSGQQRAYIQTEKTQEHINRATNQYTLPLIGKGQQERGRGNLKVWSLVCHRRGGKRRNQSVLIFPCDGSWVVCLGSCWPVPVVCVSQTQCMCVWITCPRSQQNKWTEGQSIWSWSHQL